MEEKIPHQCPHLGILDDPSTSHSFPSSWNACFHASHASVPNFEHQEKICLTSAHVTCPVYLAAKGTPFPANLINTVKAPKPPTERRLMPVFIVGAILLLAVVAGSAFFIYPNLLANALPAAPTPTPIAPAKTSEPVQATPSPTFELQIIPVLPTQDTATPTSQPTPMPFKPFPIDTPFKIGEADYLIHRIKDGDGVDILAKTYHTTPEIIRATNYLLKVPILADHLIVIRPDAIILDPAQPAFEIYMVEDKTILLDDLAKRLNVDAEKLRYYNACADRCLVSRGDWVMVPRRQ